MNTQTERLYNAPNETTVTMKVLIMIKYYWASGETIAAAWKSLQGFSGLTVREMKRDKHLIYAAFNVKANDESNDDDLTVNTYVSEMGSICYHKDYPPFLIHEHKIKK